MRTSHAPLAAFHPQGLRLKMGQHLGAMFLTGWHSKPPSLPPSISWSAGVAPSEASPSLKTCFERLNFSLNVLRIGDFREDHAEHKPACLDLARGVRRHVTAAVTCVACHTCNLRASQASEPKASSIETPSATRALLILRHNPRHLAMAATGSAVRQLFPSSSLHCRSSPEFSERMRPSAVKLQTQNTPTAYSLRLPLARACISPSAIMSNGP